MMVAMSALFRAPKFVPSNLPVARTSQARGHAQLTITVLRLDAMSARTPRHSTVRGHHDNDDGRAMT
jgi:hypothetical protein